MSHAPTPVRRWSAAQGATVAWLLAVLGVLVNLPPGSLAKPDSTLPPGGLAELDSTLPPGGDNQTEVNRTEMVLNVGFLMISRHGAPWDVERVGAAVHIAIETANREILGPVGVRLRLIERHYGPICDTSMAPGIAADFFHRDNISVLAGVGCTEALEAVAGLAAYWDIPIITGHGSSGRFLDKTKFKTLTRTSYCQCKIRAVLGSLFHQFNWTNIAMVVAAEDEFSIILAESIDSGLREREGIFPHITPYYKSTAANYKHILREVAFTSRVIIVCTPGPEFRALMLAAHELGFTTGEFVFLTVELFPDEFWGDYDWRQGDYQDAAAREAYESVLKITLHKPSGPCFDEFAKDVIEISKRDYGFHYEVEEVNFFAGAFHDAVLLYAIGLRDSLADSQYAFQNGQEFVTKYLWNTTIKGVTGDVRINENGDRLHDYPIQDFDPETGEFQTVAMYHSERDGFQPVEGTAFHWPSADNTPPLDEPFCGYMGDNPECQAQEPVNPIIIVLIAIVCGLLLLAMGGFFIFRKWKAESELKNMPWIILQEDLGEIRYTSRVSHSCLSMESQQSSYSRIYKGQLFTTVAGYKGTMVALRLIHKKSVAVNRQLLKEVKIRKNMVQDNIARFVGVVIETAPHVKLITEYCEKGSLQDLLLNEAIQLDWMFRFSLIKDIVQAMEYLHGSEVKVHGRLTSSNCLVDTRFMVKITDFGLPSFLQSDEGATSCQAEECKENNDGKSKMLWVAPEHLREQNVPPRGSQKGDVYSFAIILQEITTRGQPFDRELVFLSETDIVSRVMDTGREMPFRPSVPRDLCSEELHDLMALCWAEDPNGRPAFTSVKSFCKVFNKGQESNLMDNLLKRMQQYANNLESVVDERTKQLIDEQKKTEELLYQILPRAIATQLKAGHTVTPEWFDGVTIYFSDIVGFTSMSANSTPFEVVDFLNDLYTYFDAIVEEYDVYKVETIGDAYMVVSGVPIRNGDRHAQEIARMSLRLLSAIYSFKIRHRPGEQIKLRIGVHSGACAAGVVGLKMPRYCLFGDTVNTASRMESNGLPLKIHISSSTKAILDTFRTFEVEERGFVEVKGKGTVTTYWLLGEK